MEGRHFDLEDRLIDFALRINEIVEALPNTKLGNCIGNQLIRCASSPALNYGEAQSAESTNDFIHKLKIILKEIRESRICLKIIQRKPLLSNKNKIMSYKKYCLQGAWGKGHGDRKREASSSPSPEL